MNIVVNGEKLDISENYTISQLLEKLEVSDKVMAVAVNMEIVKKDKWDTHKIEEGDKLELLHFVGGG